MKLRKSSNVLPLSDFPLLVPKSTIQEYGKMKLETHLILTPMMMKLPLPGKCILLYAIIITYLARNRACYKSYKTFAKELNISKRTVKKYMEILIKGKYIRVIYNNPHEPYYIKNLPTNKIIVIGFDMSKVYSPKDIMKHITKSHKRNKAYVDKQLKKAYNKNKTTTDNGDNYSSNPKPTWKPNVKAKKSNNKKEQDMKDIVTFSNKIAHYISSNNLSKLDYQKKVYKPGYFIKALREHYSYGNLIPSHLSYVYKWITLKIGLPNADMVKRKLKATKQVPVQNCRYVQLCTYKKRVAAYNEIFNLIFKESMKDISLIKSDIKKTQKEIDIDVDNDIKNIMPSYDYVPKMRKQEKKEELKAQKKEQLKKESKSDDTPSPDGQDKTDKPNNSSNDTPKDTHEPKPTDKSKDKDDGKLDKKKNDDKINHQKDKNKQNNNNDDDNDNGKKHSPSATSPGPYIDKNGYYHCPF